MDLLTRFREGDLDAFEALFRQFQGRVYGWIVRIVRDPGIAEDLTVETFWRIHRARGRFDPEADFGGWAYRIAINLALSHLRRRPREQALPEDLPQSRGTNPDLAVQREERELIEHAFARLPSRLQVAVTMALIEERSYQEIADELGIPVGTVKSRVFRAVRILRKQLLGRGVHA
jgi:RNA polymerase sigma-70 factor (ECF subfamily)